MLLNLENCTYSIIGFFCIRSWASQANIWLIFCVCFNHTIPCRAFYSFFDDRFYRGWVQISKLQHRVWIFHVWIHNTKVWLAWWWLAMGWLWATLWRYDEACGNGKEWIYYINRRYTNNVLRLLMLSDILKCMDEGIAYFFYKLLYRYWRVCDGNWGLLPWLNLREYAWKLLLSMWIWDIVKHRR